MTTFNWTISATERAVALGELSDVIQVIHWRYKGTNEDGLTAEIYGAAVLGEPDPQNFTPYNEVTQAAAEAWLIDMFTAEEVVEDEITKTRISQMQEGLEAQIFLLANPVIIIAPLYSGPVVEEPVVEEPVVEEPVVEEPVVEEPVVE
jgi:hypothetical protein